MTEIDTIRIDLPEEWVRVPVDDGELEQFLRDRTDGEVWAQLPVHERRESESLLRRMVNELQAQRGEIAAVYSELVPAEDDGETALLLASFLATKVTQNEVASLLPLTAENLLAAMTASPPSERTYAELEVPVIVELPAGPSVRTRRLHRFGGKERSLFVEVFMVPVAPQFETVFVLQFSTPMVDGARPFSELFNAIASTFAMYREGEPTPA